jgi:hypothetical protein
MTILNNANWEKIKESGEVCTYRHKKRKYLEVVINTRNGMARFYDRRGSGKQLNVNAKKVEWK